jgi:putative mRNA 3-end processing factor
MCHRSGVRAPLIQATRRGLYCAAGGFHIDPSRAVDTAVITHAHSDHARPGSRAYYCPRPGAGLLRGRIGSRAPIEGIPFGEKLKLGSTWVSFHSAGHILGSAQVRIELGSEVWVVSGDYKRDSDPTCPPFETVECDAFVSEATFGLPIYRWESGESVAREILDWWDRSSRAGRNCVLFAYSLGKAQRVLAELARLTDPSRRVLVHGSVTAMNRCYEQEGVRLLPTLELDAAEAPRRLRGELVLAPPSALSGAGAERFGDFETGFASGWMRVRGGRGRKGYDRSFVLSDHADWPGLIRTIRETRAREAYLMHGSDETLARYLREQGLDARPVSALAAEEPGA